MIFKTIIDESTGAATSVRVFGKSFSELKDTVSSIKENGILNTLFYTPTIDKAAVENYNGAIREAIANGATTAEKQQIMKCAMEDTNKATAQLIKCTKGAAVESKAFTDAQKASTLAAKMHATALKAVSTAGNMILFAFISKGIELVVKGIDNWIHRVENANAAMDNAVDEYNSAKSSLENVNSELAEHNQKIDELLAKEKLTYTEKGQLEKLQEITRELLLQKDIEEKRAENASKIAAETAVDAYEKQYGRYDKTEEALKEKISFELFPVPNGKDDVLGIVAAYIRAGEFLSQSQEAYDNALKNGEDTEWLAEDIQYNVDSREAYLQALNESLADLQEKRAALEIEYNKAIDKQNSGNALLTSSEKDIINTYEEIYDIMRIAYEYTDQNTWKAMQIESVFDTEGIEKTKDELVRMVQEGTLDESILCSYSKLSDALEQNGVSASELRNELEALATAEDNAVRFAPSSSWSDGLTSSAASLDKFRSSVKSASDAYATLLAGDYSSAELLDSIRTISQTVSDLKGSIDWDAIFSSDHPLQSIQDEIASLSAAYAESILADAGIDTASGLGSMLSNIVQEAYESQAALSALNTQLNSLQSAYGSLTEIVAAYNETGSVTFDQLQTLLALEPQYLSCLLNEHGLLQVNQQAMLALANQRLNDAESQAIQQAITELHEIILQDEQTAVSENAEAFSEAANNISAYNETLADTIAETSVSAATIRDLNAAIHDRKTDGVSDLQIDTILNNLNTKLQLISSTRKSLDKNLGTIMGSPSSAPETAPEPAEPVEKAPLKEAETDWKALLDKETTLLERQLEAGVIRFREYTDRRRAILDQYYRDGKIKAADYYAALEDMYKYQLSNYDKVINAVTGQLDARIKLLEKQKEAVEDSWQVKIDALQEEIDALNKANEARKAQIDLEKAQYEAERARNQRTKKIYNGTEYLYEADRQAIRDAQDNLADQEYQLNLSRLESQMESLKEELEHATESIDQQIDALQSYRDKWNEISGEYEEQQNKLIAAEILGADWEKQVLDGRLNVLNAFKDQYIQIQQAMAAAAQAAASEQLKAGQEAAKSAASDSEPKKNDTSHETPKPGNTSSKATAKTKPPKVNKVSTRKTSAGIPRGEASQNFHMMAYSTGTENARKGLNLVGEDGIETFIGNDGSAALVTAPSLIPMEGGETVKNKQDTRELFRNLANGNSLSPGETDSMTPRTAADLFQEELRLLFPGFYNLVPQAQLLSPVPGRDAVSRLPETVPLVQNVSLTLPNVTNNSGYERLVRELKQMQIDAVQEAHRR